MRKNHRTPTAEVFKQQCWANRDARKAERLAALRAYANGDRPPPVDWSALKPVAPDHACPVCHKLNRVYNADDICVDCRTIAERPALVIERRGTGIVAGGAA